MGDSRPSRDGISLYPGVIRELEGRIINPPALQVAQWEGLQLRWSYEPEDVVALHLAMGEGDYSDPILRIPLTEDEAEIMRGLREKGHWGYYELDVEENDDRAAAHVSFISASGIPVSLLWILDKKWRTAIRKAMNRFVGIHDPIFSD